MEFELKQKDDDRREREQLEGRKEYADNLPQMIRDEYKLESPSSLAWLIYDNLNRAGILVVDDERKKQIFEQQKEKLRETARNQLIRLVESDLNRDAISNSKGICVHEWLKTKTENEIDEIGQSAKEFYKALHNL
jgi:hypothetical protein